MRIVFIVIVLFGIFFIGLSILPKKVIESLGGTAISSVDAKLTPIKENIDFYDKLGIKGEKEQIENKINEISEKGIDGLKDIKKKDFILDIPKEPKTVLEDNLKIEISKWELLGSQKNILVISFKISNGYEEYVKNKKKKVLCQTLSADNKILNESSSDLIINIKPKDIIYINDETFGYVDIETSKINCKFEEIKEEKKEEINKIESSNDSEDLLPPLK